MYTKLLLFVFLLLLFFVSCKPIQVCKEPENFCSNGLAGLNPILPGHRMYSILEYCNSEDCTFSFKAKEKSSYCLRIFCIDEQGTKYGSLSGKDLYVRMQVHLSSGNKYPLVHAGSVPSGEDAYGGICLDLEAEEVVEIDLTVEEVGGKSLFDSFLENLYLKRRRSNCIFIFVTEKGERSAAIMR